MRGPQMSGCVRGIDGFNIVNQLLSVPIQSMIIGFSLKENTPLLGTFNQVSVSFKKLVTQHQPHVHIKEQRIAEGLGPGRQ